VTEKAPRVVVIGGGFGGIEVARALGRAKMPVTLIDRQNYHLFQPLLYQVATAALSPADIAEPIRKILRRYRSAQVILGEVERIDRDARDVVLREGRRVPYDVLVLATGATHSYFGHPEWERSAPGLKTIADARLIRSEILRCFEEAEITEDAAERERLMTFAVVGGGPTGVEMAGAIAELARYVLAKDFRNIRPERAKVLLIEAGSRLLAAFPENLANYAENRLKKLGVTVLLNSPVKPLSRETILIDGRTLPVGATIWAAGVAASPAASWIGVETDKAGRIRVAPDLSVPGVPDIFVIGDVALALDEHGNPLPGLAQVAKQEGVYLGQALARRLPRPFPPFRYHSRGNTAVIGRNAAIFDFGGGWELKGWIAWFFWAFIHIYLLVGFEHRLLVSVQWLWRYFTYEQGARLIVDEMRKGERVIAPTAE
jgi:NADH:ubiquinone reductase (H+-translocating)